MPQTLGFQLTRPLRGVTTDGGGTETCVDISTHTPLAGRDGGRHHRRGAGRDFNSHAPCGA